MSDTLPETVEFPSSPPWTGPSKLITIRTSKNLPFESLLRKTFKEPTGIRKLHREGPVHLGPLGFANDEHYYKVHGGPEKAVLQYNPRHYAEWKDHLKDIPARDVAARDKLLNLGGFGENMAVEEQDQISPPMDERTMCIGDLVSFRSTTEHGSIQEHARIRVTGPRLPCFKLNHRFGTSGMSQRTQDHSWTGWLYSVDTEGEVEVGHEVALIERPFPKWPVARIQHYLFKDPKNLDMIKEALSTLGDKLVYDVRDTFTNRLTKGTEDMSTRLQGEKAEVFVRYRLRDRRRETARVSQFIFDRVEKLPEDSPEYTVAQSGSHIRLRFKPNDTMTTTMTRPYSMMSGNTNTFTLGIALADKSRGGSTYLHQHIQVGDELEVSENFANTFALAPKEATDTHVFLAGGIGITAFLDHIQHCIDTRQKFHLHYMIRNESDYAFKDMLEKMLADTDANGNSFSNPSDREDAPLSAASENSGGSTNSDSESDSSTNTKKPRTKSKISIYISATNTRLNTKHVLSKIARHNKTHIYICGSEKLSDAIRTDATTLKIPNSRLHFEQFSLDSSGDPFVAELARQGGRKVEVRGEQSLLDALREAGVEVASSCEAGNCATCVVRVKCGRILYRDTGLPDDAKAGAGEEGLEEGNMLSCVSRGVGTICLDV